MSPKPIVLDPDLERLQKEGYEIEVRDGHLLVHSVPYVNAQRNVLQGIIVTNLNGNIGKLGPPSDHQVWFAGEYPCHHTGAPIDGIRCSSGSFKFWDGFEAQHHFSCKPEGGSNYPDYYSKVKSYISIISNEAKVIDPSTTPLTFKIIVSAEQDTIFRYWDSASSRANIVAVSEKLLMNKVAIIGLGGTGSYVLDLAAKTPIREIHLFDGDIFHQHNAFRSPGAPSITTLQAKPAKVDYFASVYNEMRTGIVPHCCYLTEDNIVELTGFDFVFMCVDKGAVRRLLSDFLHNQNIPFIDVGMELIMIQEDNCILGTCRATLSTPERNDHFERRAPMGNESGNDLYKSNIQVADMNALNATLAVIKWKQYYGFYQDVYKFHHTTYSVNAHSLTRDEITGMSDTTP
ncbi:MAG: hypothetical protein CVU71_14840 [Deltaproteobacteria bacterium HGW-Deltaproteobacteria-6]|jgi:molybdopterin/thiamine biosynthesis adenylyltransferase|nr:MAG: hypothetical protein CVU71_14840 [Deltaproteobacteria bacterium HGW-Deltaproteobacteria-6]